MAEDTHQVLARGVERFLERVLESLEDDHAACARRRRQRLRSYEAWR
jgi:hypothetical protein